MIALVAAVALVCPVAAPAVSLVPVESTEVELAPVAEAVPGWSRTLSRAAKPRPGLPPWLPDHHQVEELLPPPRPACDERPAAPRFAPPSPDLLVLVQRFTC